MRQSKRRTKITATFWKKFSVSFVAKYFNRKINVTFAANVFMKKLKKTNVKIVIFVM